MIILIEILHYFNKGQDDASTNYILETFIEIKERLKGSHLKS